MRRALCSLAVIALMGVASARAQNIGGEDTPARARLRQQIEDRFAVRVKEQVGLSDEQLTKLRGTWITYGTRRRELQAHERLLRSALAAQMRPCVAANQDSVSRLTDGLVNLRSSYAQLARDENKEMATYLTPVQRTQLLAMRERFLQRIQEIRQEQRARQGPLQQLRERRQQRRQQPPP